jgi:argininosuccinate lyase
MAGAIETMQFRRERLRDAMQGGHLCATDLADLLVQKGMAFREAHHAVGGLVRDAERLGCQLAELPSELLTGVHPGLTGTELDSALDPVAATERRRIVGGPAREPVTRAVTAARVAWASPADD